MPESRIAPDPFAVVLPALAALGAIASIAAAGWVAEDSPSGRNSETTRRAQIAAKELETSCVGMGEIFRRLQRQPELFSGDGRYLTSRMKFGVQGGRTAQSTAALYDRLINDIAAMLVLAAQNANAVMRAVEDGEFNAPDALFNAFGECQDDLNVLLQERATLTTCIDKGIELAGRLTALVRELRSHHVG